jgi:hypothetical protein
MLIGCDNKVLRKSLCASHYQRWVRHGESFNKNPIPNNKYDLITRFKMKMGIPNKDECMIFIGAKQKINGYGKFMMGSRKEKNKNAYLAHRVSYQLFKGNIPKGMCVLHRCDQPACVNPKHLFLGTQRDNMHDMISKGRAIHPLGKR